MQKGIAGLFLIIGFLVVLSAVVGAAFYLNKLENSKITDFVSCSKAGNPVMESYPAQCNTKDGRHFVQELSDEDKQKLIPPQSSDSGKICAQVITPAKNPKTSECKEFPTPCDVSEGWEKVGSCSNSQNTTGTSGWKTYRNNNLRVEFKYPPNVYIDNESNDSVTLKLEYRPKGQFMDIPITFRKSKQRKTVKYDFILPDGKVVNKTALTCDKQSEYYQNYKTFLEPCWDKVIIDGKEADTTLPGGGYYFISEIGLEFGIPISSDRENMEQMISTLKFL